MSSWYAKQSELNYMKKKFIEFLKKNDENNKNSI
jgi:hypothetical protein